MKKTLFSTLSLVLALVMVLGAFAACGKKTTQTPTVGGNETNAPSTSEKPNDTENGESNNSEGSEGTEAPGIVPTPSGSIEATHEELINYTNNLSNGVQAYFTNGQRTHFSLQNKIMTMNYSRSAANDQLVESIKNTSGHSYIEQTMDVFVKMTDNSIHYASQSSKSAETNLYRFGYYYYEALFQFQDFVPKEYPVSNQAEITMNQFNKDRTNGVALKKSGGHNYFTVTNTSDPYFTLDGFSYDTTEYNTLVITAKTVGQCVGGELFISVNNKAFNQRQSASFSFIGDGEYHTYYINLASYQDYEGTLNALRFDLAGSVGEGIAIQSLYVGKAELDESIPQDLKINRHFHVYSDKMHHTIQFATLETTENIAEVGMITKIDVNTVDKILIIDNNGQHTSLDGVDWESVESVGFDIKDAGIFGFIMPVHEAAGKIMVTQENNAYVITQTRTPEGGVINPSIGGIKDGNYVHAAGVKNNGNDFWLGQRVYTDENHDFDKFITETYFERNPLTEKNIRINNAASDNSQFMGYDPLRGIYSIKTTGPSDFYKAYNQPNKDYKVKFNVVALEEDRDFYMMVTAGGILECAAIMSAEMLMLPIPVEVIKNFSEPNGERNLFNIDDPGFGEAIFCLTADADTKYEYTVITLYQNWGNFPLKQLSQIPFFCPYYHLSTGVTETNCILPWFGTANVGKGGAGNTLPDFRSMSAPFWQSQPQHNSCGTHYWLQYTDADGSTYAVESTANYITSYGPTYAEVVMENISDDGKIKVTYTHMEMPQTDENRSYYTMEYEILDELTIKDFKHNFQFYKVTDNNSTGSYKKIGYLDENNVCQVSPSTQESTKSLEFVLGKECPYFSFFMMPDWNRDSDSAEGYSNVAFLVHSSEFIIGGEKKDPNFYIVNTKNYVSISLNLDEVTFKAGDKLTVNAILLPWGSQELEDDPANRLNKDHATGYTEYTYSTELEDGTLYMDKNVRDVRENTLLKPLTVTSETDKIVESPFLPRVKSKDGKTAEFTLSGGANNSTVRVYGFDRLTSPKVEELVDGEWVEYAVSSKNSPDKNGYYHYYDGYSVQYDGNGQYSYSFVVDMKDGSPRTFRVTADEEFDKWPRENLPEENENLLKVYADPEEIFEQISLSPGAYGTPILGEDEKIGQYVSIYINPQQEKEAYSTFYEAEQNPAETGQYFVMLYRVPDTNKETLGSMELWSKTVNEKLVSKQDNMGVTPKASGNWELVIYDLSKSAIKNFKASDDEKFYANVLRLDIFNKQYTDPDTHIDIAFIGIESSLQAICELEAVKNNFEKVTLYENGTPVTVSVEAGDKYVPTYIHPSSDYTQADLLFGSTIDYINGNLVSIASRKNYGMIKLYKGASINKNMTLVLAGWAVVEGGVNKYVWSADGGKTWNDCIGNETLVPGTSDVINHAFQATGHTPTEADTKNCKFQKANGPLTIDLSRYAGQTVSVTLAAVPENDTSSLLLLYCFEDVNCSLESAFVEGSQYLESYKSYGASTDYFNNTKKGVESSSANGSPTVEITAQDDYTVRIVGWAAVDGGISKYLWTADKGATWNMIEQTSGISAAHNGIIDYAQKLAQATFSDYEKSKTNGRFQGSQDATTGVVSGGILIDLSAYKDRTEPVEVYFCALPQEDSERVVVLYKLNVTMP